MTLTTLLKHRLILTLFTLSITLQITACSTEEPSATNDYLTSILNEYSANSTDINSNTNGNTEEHSEIPTDVVSTDVVRSTDTLSNIILSWIAPVAREDNSPLSLSEIAGYRVYYGTVQGDYLNSIHIDDGSADSHSFEVPSSGTYYIVMTTYDIDGRESVYSPELTVYT